MVADRLPRPIRIVLAMALVSCLGSGLTLPFLLVYLHDVRHITLAATGLLIALPAVVGLVATPATGALIDALGARNVCGGAMVAAAGGSALLVTAHAAPSAVIPLLLLGVGEAGIATGVNTLFAQLLADPARQVRAFSIQFTLVNAGLGIGALVAGELVSLHRPGTFTLLYLLDALTFLLPAIACLAIRVPYQAVAPMREPRVDRETTRGLVGRYGEVLGHATFVRYALLLGAIYLVGYASLDAGFVGFSTEVARVSPRLVADSFAVNTAVIVCLQQLVTRWITKRRRSAALAASAAAFGAAWIVAWAASQFPGSNLDKGLILAFGAVFAVGEMTLSPVRNVVVNALATDRLRGRYNATSWCAIQLANIVAPALIGVMLGAHLGRSMVLGLAVLAGLVAAVAYRFGRQLSPEQDNRALIGAFAAPIGAGEGATGTDDPPACGSDDDW
ncbi:MAG: putative transporter [Acidimicrobiaceae bacterium]|nr:putative transporter [Acidimicrobiaceae bacterium]